MEVTGDLAPAYSRLTSGRRIWVYDITATDVGVNDAVAITLPTKLFTVSMFKAALSVAGDATTIQPSISTAQGVDSDDILFVTATDTAAASVVNANLVLVYSRFNSLVIKISPDDTADEVRMQVVIADGIPFGGQ